MYDCTPSLYPSFMNDLQDESSNEVESGSQLWESTKTQHLIRYKPSGVYFAKFKVKGKQFRFSLKTKVLTVARTRLSIEQNKRKAVAFNPAIGKVSFSEVLRQYREVYQSNPNLKVRSKAYSDEIMIMVIRSWPDSKVDALPLMRLAKMEKKDAVELLLQEWSEAKTDVAKITDAKCEQWARYFSNHYSATRYNNALSMLKHVFDISMKIGVRYDNPVAHLKRARVRSKQLQLPTREQFVSLVTTVETAGGRDSKNCANMMRFLAYTGMRLNEGTKVKWADVDFEKGEILVRGDEETGTKNWDTRKVPMIPECKNLLEKLKVGKEPNELVLNIRECQKAINRACKLKNVPRFTHHDLRHLFATRCIESGVDIPTISRWLGHKDGGALAMKTYGHLRDEHSKLAAQKVVF